MTLTKKVIVNTLAQMSTKTITVIIGIVVRKLLAVYLGPAGLGEYFFTITLATIFGSIADFGTVMITVREAAKDKANAPSIFGAAFWLRIGFSAVAMLLASLTILFILSSSISSELKNISLFGTLLILVFSTKASLSIVFQTLLKMEQWSIPEISASLFTFLLTFIAIQTQKGLFEILASLMLGNTLAIAAALFLSRRLVKINFRPQKRIILPLVKNAIPMGGVLVVYSIYNKLDTVMLQTMMGSQAVGIYGAAYSVYDVLVLGAAYFMNTILPILSGTITKTDEKSKNRSYRIFQKSFATLFFLATVVFLAVVVLAPIIIAIIASPEFNQSTEALRILAFAIFISYLNHLTGYTLVVLNKQKTFFIITIVALFTNIISNFFLIPLFAQNGSALATVLTEGVVFVLTTALIYKTNGWLPRPSSIPETARDLILNRGKILNE